MPDIDTYKSIADQKNIITNLQIENKVMAAAVNMNIIKKDY